MAASIWVPRMLWHSGSPKNRPRPTHTYVGELRSPRVLRILRNPIYAGVYVFGRHEERMALVDGELRRRHKRVIAPNAWKTCLHDHHPAYIGWEEFMANQRKLDDNRTNQSAADHRGAAREGLALLQGLALWGRCGRRMSTRYRGTDRHGDYQCRAQANAGDVCFAVAATAIDETIAKLLLGSRPVPG